MSGGSGGGLSIPSTGNPSNAVASDVTTTTLYPVTGRGMSRAAPIAPMTFNIFGVDDPVVQRQLVEAVNKGIHRGLKLDVA